jgi:hypothetical protein
MSSLLTSLVLYVLPLIRGIKFTTWVPSETSQDQRLLMPTRNETGRSMQEFAQILIPRARQPRDLYQEDSFLDEL